jgi:hypothetical protein
MSDMGRGLPALLPSHSRTRRQPTCGLLPHWRRQYSIGAVRRDRKVMPKYHVTPAAQRAGREVVRARRREGGRSAPIVKEPQASGVTSLNAEAFNARGVPAPAGRRYATQVARVLKWLAG